MIAAYSENYLDDAMRNLGEAVDYAVNECKIGADEFVNLFVTEGFADDFGKGDPKVVSGVSGTELVMNVLRAANMNVKFPKAQVNYEYSAEYWSGWILAYYQWKTGRSFRNIKENISMKEILKMYPTLHEASEDKFADKVDKIIANKETASRLQHQRKLCGYSQSELSKKSGVNLRTLQQYELKTKNINKASVETVMSLANALGCQAEEIIEYKAGKGATQEPV